MFKYIAISCGLFLLVFISHARSRVIVSTDSMWSIYLAKSMVVDGDLILDEYRDLAKERKNYGLRKRKGQLYSYFPVGTALLATPFVWIYEKTLPLSAQFLPGFPASQEISAEDMNLPLQRVIASLFVALTVVIIFLFASQSLPIVAAISVALIAAFGTSLWSTASRGLWQHGPGAMLIMGSLYLISKARTQPLGAGISGALLAFAYIVRPTNAIAFICFGLFLLLTNKEAFRIFTISALLIFIPFLAFSYDFFARIVPPYYNANRLHLGWHLPEALLANLLSPNRGIFFLSPVLLPSLIAIYRTLRFPKADLLSVAVLAAFFGHLLSVSLFPEWWGGHAFGARYMCETIPYLIYFFIIWLRDLPSLKKSTLSFLVFSAALSFWIHFKGADDMKTFMWNVNPVNLDRKPARVWDISDLQFLR